MAIEIIEVITLQEYRTAGLGTDYDDRKVKEAINTAFLQLNSVCDHNISKRWNLQDTDPLYIPEDKKQYVKEAFCLQTTWNLKNNLNMGSIGSQQESLGSWSHSYNNPKEKEVICPGVLDLLQQAGLYKSVVGKSMNVLNRHCGIPPFGTEPIEGDVSDLAFVRWGEANNKFLPKYLGIEYKDLILYVDSNGYIRTKDINDFNLTKYQTITDNDLLTADKTIVGAINEIASSTPVTINWDTEPTANHNAGYAVTSAGVKTYVDNKETNLQSQITINTNDIEALEESIITVDITPRTFENETLDSGINEFVSRFDLPVDYNFEILGVVSARARMQNDDRRLQMAITLINKESYQGYNIYIQSLIYNNSTSITDNLTINIKLLVRKI